MPLSSTVAAAALASAIGTTVTAMLAGVPAHSAVAIGNACGAFVYLMESEESHRAKKYGYWIVSFVLGYGIAPKLADRIAWMPDMLAGALSSAVVVVALIAIVRQAEKTFPKIAERVGATAEQRADDLTGGNHDQ